MSTKLVSRSPDKPAGGGTAAPVAAAAGAPVPLPPVVAALLGAVLGPRLPTLESPGPGCTKGAEYSVRGSPGVEADVDTEDGVPECTGGPLVALVGSSALGGRVGTGTGRAGVSSGP